MPSWIYSGLLAPHQPDPSAHRHDLIYDFFKYSYIGTSPDLNYIPKSAILRVMHGFFTFPILMWSFDYTLIRWVDQAAWLKARLLFLAISNVGDLIASGVSYLIVRLRSPLGLPMEVDPDRISRKEGREMQIVVSRDITFLLLLG